MAYLSYKIALCLAVPVIDTTSKVIYHVIMSGRTRSEAVVGRVDKVPACTASYDSAVSK